MDPSSFAGEPRAGRIRSMCATPTMGVHKWFRVESTDCPQHDLVPAQELFGIEQSHRNRVSGTITMGIRSRRRTQKKDDESKKKEKKNKTLARSISVHQGPRRSPCVALRQFVCEDLFREREQIHSPVTGPMACHGLAAARKLNGATSRPCRAKSIKDHLNQSKRETRTSLMRISAVAVAVGRAARGRDVATPRVMGRDDLVLELHLFFVRTWCTVR